MKQKKINIKNVLGGGMQLWDIKKEISINIEERNC